MLVTHRVRRADLDDGCTLEHTDGLIRSHLYDASARVAHCVILRAFMDAELPTLDLDTREDARSFLRGESSDLAFWCEIGHLSARAIIEVASHRWPHHYIHFH